MRWRRAWWIVIAVAVAVFPTVIVLTIVQIVPQRRERIAPPKPEGPPDLEKLRAAFAGGRRKKWRLNHTPLYLDFLEGKVDFPCMPWGIPSYSIFGWQRPCYLMSDGYTTTYRELIETTDWSQYGRQSGNPKCQNCMAHCGYEPTAVLATMGSLKESIRAMVGV
jgi:hypothetical protein